MTNKDVLFNKDKIAKLKSRMDTYTKSPPFLLDDDINKEYRSHFDKKVDITPIKELILEYADIGMRPVSYTSSIELSLLNSLRRLHSGDWYGQGRDYGGIVECPVSFNNTLRSLTGLFISFQEGDIDTLFKIIENDIRNYHSGRIIAIHYPHGINDVNTASLYFAYHPQDKDHPILKDIWVDVYK